MPDATIRVVLFDAVGTLIRPRTPVAEIYHAVARRFGSQRTVSEIAARFPIAFRRHMGPEDEVDVPEGLPAPPARLGSGARIREANTAWSAVPHYDRPATSEHEEKRRWQSIVAEVIDDVAAGQEALFAELWAYFADWRHWELLPDVMDVWAKLEENGYELGIASNFDGRLPLVCSQLDPLVRAEHLFYSSALRHAKPSPHFFRAIEQRLGRRPEELVLVGDDRENDWEGARAAGWHALLVDRHASADGEAGVIRSLGELPEQLA